MSTELSPDLKKRFAVSTLSDGSLMVEASANSGWQDVGVSIYGNGIMVAICGYIDYELLKITGWKLSLTDLLSWVEVGAFLALWGSVFNFLWTLQGRTEWEVRPNELRWRRRLFGLSWVKVFRDGSLSLRRRCRGQAAIPWYSLHVRTSGRCSGSMFASTHLVLVEELANWLVAQVGWSVERDWK